MNSETPDLHESAVEYTCTVQHTLPACTIDSGLLHKIEQSLNDLACSFKPTDGSEKFSTQIEINGKRESEFLSSLDQWEHRPAHSTQGATFKITSDESSFSAYIELSREDAGLITLVTEHRGSRSLLETSCKQISQFVIAAGPPSPRPLSLYKSVSLDLPPVIMDLERLQRLQDIVVGTTLALVTEDEPDSDPVSVEIDWALALADGRTLHVRELSVQPFQLDVRVEEVTLSACIESSLNHLTVMATMANKKPDCEVEIDALGPLDARFIGEMKRTLEGQFELVRSPNGLLHSETSPLLVLLSLVIMISAIMTIVVSQGRLQVTFLVVTTLGMILVGVLGKIGPRRYPYCAFPIGQQTARAQGPYAFTLMLLTAYLVIVLVTALVEYLIVTT